jgi:hypothetical protein
MWGRVHGGRERRTVVSVKLETSVTLPSQFQRDCFLQVANGGKRGRLLQLVNPEIVPRHCVDQLQSDCLFFQKRSAKHDIF